MSDTAKDAGWSMPVSDESVREMRLLNNAAWLIMYGVREETAYTLAQQIVALVGP